MGLRCASTSCFSSLRFDLRGTMHSRFVPFQCQLMTQNAARLVLHGMLLLPWIFGCLKATAQTTATEQSPANVSQIPAAASGTPVSGQSTAKLQPITTTVVVQGHVVDDYLPTD